MGWILTSTRLFMTEKIIITVDLNETRVFKTLIYGFTVCVEAPWKNKLYNRIKVTIASSFIEFAFLYNNDYYAGEVFIDLNDDDKELNKSLKNLACNLKPEDFNRIYDKLKENLSNLINKVKQIYAIASLLT